MNIDILLTEEQRMVRDTARRYVDKEVIPHRLEWDEANFPGKNLSTPISLVHLL